MMRVHRKQKYRVMPIGLQKYNIKRVFNKANPDSDFDDIDLDLDSKANYYENLEDLKKEYPQYIWELEQKRYLGDSPVWIREPSNPSIRTTSIRIKSHKVKHKYLFGRIQVTVDKEWIGCKAEISVKISR